MTPAQRDTLRRIAQVNHALKDKTPQIQEGFPWQDYSQFKGPTEIKKSDKKTKKDDKTPSMKYRPSSQRKPLRKESLEDLDPMDAIRSLCTGKPLDEAQSKYNQIACDNCKKDGPVPGLKIAGIGNVCKGCFDADKKPAVAAEETITEGSWPSSSSESGHDMPPKPRANHISNLTTARDDAHAKIAAVDKDITNFLTFLHSSKFTGSEDGERKDWISTGDVVRWLTDMRSALQ